VSVCLSNLGDELFIESSTTTINNKTILMTLFFLLMMQQVVPSHAAPLAMILLRLFPLLLLKFMK
jgi:hypothetical protein